MIAYVDDFNLFDGVEQPDFSLILVLTHWAARNVFLVTSKYFNTLSPAAPNGLEFIPPNNWEFIVSGVRNA